jgi:TolB-like protein/Flp pilus assembly protein TadD
MSFIAELKRRNVLRAAGLYLVGSWLVVQVASTVFPAFGVPGWALRSLIITAAIGFLPAMVVAWVFELTPDGIKRDEDVRPEESIAPQTGQRMDRWLLVVSVVAIGYFAFDKFVLAPQREAALVTQTTAHVTAAIGAEKAKVDPDSIAVLPFVNLSSDKEQEYFSDGISEELLNLLAKVPKLRVIARTSSFSFKGKQVAIPDIARALNVASILEGSVQKSGNTVRISVQLVHAADSTQLWSQTYDRQIDDIFKVQDEIAAAVVDKLKITLLGAAPTAKPIDAKAHQLILQAEALAGQGSAAGRAQALVLLQQALTTAPDNVRVLEGFADVYLNQALNNERSRAEGFRLGREALNKILAIDPDDAAAHSFLGWIASSVDGDKAAAASHFQRALALAPADTAVINNAAIFVRSLGREDEAIALFIQAVANDPADPVVQENLGLSYYFADRWDQAIASSRTALNLSPGIAAVHFNIGSALLLGKDDPAGALKEMQADPDEITRMTGLALAYHALGQKSESDTALAALIARHEHDAAIFIAAVLAYRGEPDRAFEWLDKAAATRDPNLPDVFHEPLFAKLQHDPRWLPFLRRIGQAPEQLAKIDFKLTLPGQGASR